MGRITNHKKSATRQQILRAALKNFSEFGYAATSVQQIVRGARVSKPVLYYYFRHKAGLYQALVDQAHDERYRLMVKGAEAEGSVAEKLTEIAASILEFSLKNRELMRLAFVTALAATGGAPGSSQCREKGRRNWEFMRDLIRQGQAQGELTPDFSADELTMGIYGQLNSYIMARLLIPDIPLNRKTAEKIVRLFLEGAGTRALSPQHPLLSLSRGPCSDTVKSISTTN